MVAVVHHLSVTASQEFHGSLGLCIIYLNESTVLVWFPRIQPRWLAGCIRGPRHRNQAPYPKLCLIHLAGAVLTRVQWQFTAEHHQERDRHLQQSVVRQQFSCFILLYSRC
jgi:hypothetical protein